MWWSSASGTSRLIGSIRYQAGVQHSVIWFKKLVITWGQYLNHSEGERSRSACSGCFSLHAQSRPAGSLSPPLLYSFSFSYPSFSSLYPPLLSFFLSKCTYFNDKVKPYSLQQIQNIVTWCCLIFVVRSCSKSLLLETRLLNNKMKFVSSLINIVSFLSFQLL